MATLEVHDGKGRVEYVTVTRDRPLLIGADPKCHVVVTDKGALPFHARFLWKRGRFKVEATPEARFLMVNGKKLVSSSFRQGDEFQVGATRFFFLNDDSGEPTREGEDDQATVVQEKAAVAPRLEAESLDWLRNDPVAPMSEEAPSPLTRGGARKERGRGRAEGATACGKAAAPAPPTTVIRKVLRNFSGKDQEPGEERLARSPLVIGLVVSIAGLGLLSYLLWGVISRQSADNQYRRAVDYLADGDHLNAVKQFEQFLTTAPGDPRAGKATVLRSLATVRQFTGGAGGAWGEGLRAAQQMVEEVGSRPEFEDSRIDLAAEVLRVVEGLAVRARGGDAASLEQAEAALAFHAEVAGEAAAEQRHRSRVPLMLGEAREAVRRSTLRREAIARMDTAIKASQIAAIYESRDRLVAAYPEMAEDREILNRLTQAGELILKNVKYDASTRPAEAQPRDELLGPATTLVLRDSPGNGSSASLTGGGGPVVYAVVDGVAYALSASDGRALWQIPVGLGSAFRPLPIEGTEPSALLHDARSHELARVDADTGALLWRQGLEEALVDPPLVVGSQVIQPLPSGKLYRLDLETGEIRGVLDLGRPITRSPVTDEAGKYLYVLGNETNLFVINRDLFRCEDVTYLGHQAGSLPCAPTRVASYLVVPENNAYEEGRWRVLELEAGGPGVKLKQTLPVQGWTWSSPPTAGSVIWSVSDRGEVAAYAIGASTDREPLQKIAELPADAAPGGPAFGSVRTDRELWTSFASRITRLDLSPERGRIQAGWSVVEAGPAVAGIQRVGRLAVMTQRAANKTGVAIWAIDSTSGTQQWRTWLGSGWPVGPSESLSGSEVEGLDVLGKPITLSEAALRDGGFVSLEVPPSTSGGLPAGDYEWVKSDEGSVLFPGNGTDRLLAVTPQEGVAKPLELPVSLAASPVFLGSHLLAPGTDGLVYLVDGKSGLTIGDPFVPLYDRSRPYRWLRPLSIDDQAALLADQTGRLRRVVVRADEQSTRLQALGEEIDLGQPLAAAPAATQNALIVVTAGGEIRSLALRDLSPNGLWNLDSALAFPPVGVEGWVFVCGASGSLHAFGPGGQRQWESKVAGSFAVAPPVLREGGAWFLTREGSLVAYSLEDGRELAVEELGVLPASRPLLVGSSIVVPSARGSLRPIDPSKVLERQARPAGGPPASSGQAISGEIR